MLDKSKDQLLQELINLQNNFDLYKSTIEKNYETKIKESQYSFETIFQTNPDAVTVTGIDDGKIIQVNNSFLSITGYSKEEILGKTTQEINLWVDSNDRKKILFELEQKGKIENYEAPFRMKDGSIVIGLISGRTFEYNKEFCLLLIVRDITDYKKLVDRAIYNELRFRAFFRTNESGISILDLDGNFKSANEKLCNMLGYTLEEIKGKNFKDISYQRDIKTNQEMLKKLYSGEINSFTVEKRYVRKDNTYYWAEIFVTGIFNKTGKLIETIGIQNDITQRKYVELKNRFKFELSTLIEKDYNDEELYSNLSKVLSDLFSIRDNYFAFINEDKKFTYKRFEPKGKKLFEIDKKDEILIKYTLKNKKAVTLNGDEISELFKKISGEKLKVKFYSWQSVPILVSDKVKLVLVVRLFEEQINLSEKQIELLEDTAKIISDLLEKRKAINEITLLSQVLDQSPVIAIITDINGNIEYVNKRTTEITGYKTEELINQNPRIFKSGEHKKEVYKELWDTVLAGKTWIGDLLNKKKSGELYWSRNIISPIFNSTGKIVNLVALNLDVTELKDAELESQKLNLLINNSKDFIAFRDMDEKLTFLNKGGRELVGLSQDEDVTKLKVIDFLGEKYYKKSAEKIIPTVMEKGYWHGEHALKHFKTGKYIPILSSVFLIKDTSTGKPIGVGSIQHDLTDIYDAINALKQSEENFKTLADNSLHMIYIYSEDKFLYVNKMFLKILGYSEKEIFDPKFDLLEKIIAPESIEDVLHSIEEHKKGNEVEPYDARVFTKDGKAIDIIDSSNVIEFNGQKAVMGILTDITQRKKVEKEILAAKERAEELNRLKSSFYANMSHELRTPLVGIMGASEILKEEVEKEDLKDLASIIYSSGTRLTKTLNNILNLSKISSQKMEMDNAEVDILNLVSERANFFRNAAESKGLYIKLNKGKDQIKIKLDRERFSEVIDNILNNAIKFTNNGGILIDVRKQKSDDKIYSVISIKDTGIGIEAKDIKYIFDEYRQVSEGLTRKYEGTGLGLTISKKYVELMNGTIEVESKVNEGSNFIIKFPSD